MLTLESSDSAALDLLASPKVPTLNLYRKVNTKVTIDPAIVRTGHRGGSLLDATTKAHKPISSASWWVSRLREDASGTSVTDPNKRTLNGEVRIPDAVKPSFEFGNYFVQVRCGNNFTRFTSSASTTVSWGFSASKWLLFHPTLMTKYKVQQLTIAISSTSSSCPL